MYVSDIFKLFPDRVVHLINHVTGIAENERLLNIFIFKILDKCCMFVFWVLICKIMINAFRRLPFRYKGDMPGVTQTVMSEFFDIFRHRRGEKECLVFTNNTR